MKEYCKKFSKESDEHQPEEGQENRYPAQDDQPVFHDLRFLVTESVNLGFRVMNEISRMLKKLEE